MTKVAFASRHSMMYVAETEPGAMPENPQMKGLRHTSTSLNLTRDSFVSEEKRQDRQITDVRTGTNQIGGDIGFELSFGEYDDFLEACLAGTWENDELKSGVEDRSFTIVRAFNDIRQYVAYTGCRLNTLNLSLQPNAMITATFGVVGLDAETSDSPFCENPTPSKTGRPFDTYTGALKEGDETIAVVTGIDITLDNGIQPQFVLFQRSAPIVSWGRSSITGTLTAFFENASLIKKFLDETPTSLEFTLGGPDGSYTVTLPSIRYTGSETPVDSDGPVSISMPFQAVLDECSGTNIIIRRTPGENTQAQPCALAWSSEALAESAATPGAIDDKITVTLSGDKTFAGSDGLALPGVSFANVPAGLVATVSRTGATTAEISFTGEAVAHQAADSAQITVTFSAASFVKGFCHCAGGTVEGLEKQIALTFTDDATEPDPDPGADTGETGGEDETPETTDETV